MDKGLFLKKYNIQEKDFNETNLEWDNLLEIYNDYKSISQDLESTANMISDYLKKVDMVHSIKQRIKDPEHLIEKIIRKKIKNKDREITLENYTEQITDLIGIRAIHLFKEDWESIHDYITKKWETAENPTANVRLGDSDELIDKFIKKGCEINQHEFGYRSIHYLIKTRPDRRNFIAEIQVRTIFEEGWSEIDHKIRYPYYIDDPILANYLEIFNRLAGSADEMGSFVKFLCDELKNINECHNKELEEKDMVIIELKDTIDKLTLNKTQKEDLQKIIESLEKKLSLSNKRNRSYDLHYTNTINEILGRPNRHDVTKIMLPGIRERETVSNGKAISVVDIIKGRK